MPVIPPYIYRNRAPHLRVDGAAYFITWRVQPGTPDFTPAERTLIAETIQRFHPERYIVHVLCLPQVGYNVSQLVHSWKSYPANRMQREHGRSGSVFQKEYHDHAVVSYKQLRQKAEYIYHNPYKRWPELKEYQWWGGNPF